MILIEAWITIAIIIACLSSLVFTRYAADIIMMAGVTLLLVSGVLTADEALGGFANEGMITVAVLYIVANGLTETGAISWLSGALLGRPSSTLKAQFRLMIPVAALSAFMNNTPVVAMFIPMVSRWARHHNLHASKLMIPLSYAAILGGACTLIGSSTNLILNSMLTQYDASLGLGMFDLAWVGLPAALILTCVVIFLGKWLLPSHGSVSREFEETRRYTIEMLVEAGSGLCGKTVEQAGLRNLSGVYLSSIERQGEVKPAVGPSERLQGGDRLIFVGIVESVVDLKRIRGLTAVAAEDQSLLGKNFQNFLVEVVVSPSCPLVRKTIRDGRFRTHYNAAIVAVARGGVHLQQKVGDIILEAGDTLLIDAAENFIEQQRYSKDFLLVSTVKNSQTVRHDRSIIALSILFFMVLAVTFQWLSMLQAAMLAAGTMLLSGCTTGAIARKSIDWQVLVVIGASIAMGSAVHKSGLADFIANTLIISASITPTIALIKLFLLTALFTSILSNAAAAVILFPIAVASSQALDVSLLPFVVTLMIAASASFATPIGYQTNLMVMGPGGYRFSDFLKIGLPMTLIMGAVIVTIVPLVWPF
jgi:di/tricarboxylate transporter